MAKVQQSIEVNAPLQACFDQWMRFEEFPRFLDHVKSIRRQGDNRWQWEVDGPMGMNVTWDAVMDGKLEDKLVSWHSVADSTVDTQGAVRFEELSPSRTRMDVTIQYEPPGGMLGSLVGKLLANPDTMVRDALEKFKTLMEGKVGAASSAL